MKVTIRNCISAVILLLILLVFAGCGGGGGGAGAGGGGGLTPTADNFDWTGNTPLTVGAVNGLFANDPVGSVIADPGTRTTTLGGTADVAANGSFNYVPPPGVQNVSDTFTYTVAGSAPVTVTINLVERVWFVRNDNPGVTGTFADPFPTLAEAETASDADDTIFVFAGDFTDTGQDEGITLKAGQRLLGVGAGLRVAGIPVVDRAPPNSRISNAGLGGAAGDIPVVMLSTGNEVAGLTINAAFNEAILAPGGSGHRLHDNTVTFGPANGREGIRLLNVAGENSVTFNTITGSPRDGIKLANNEDQAGDPAAVTPIVATVTLSRNTITGSAQDGIFVSLEGAGTEVALNILTNRITDSGVQGAGQGIGIDSLGGASVTGVVSRNTVTQSTDEAVDLQASNTSALSAFVANNGFSLSGAGVTDFLAETAAGSSANFCLELDNNFNDAGDSTFQVENNGNGVFQLFEGINDTVASPGVIGAISLIGPGGCGITLPGAALFVVNCTICHTGNGLGLDTRKVLPGPDVTNQNAAEIDFQLANNLAMITINLTGREVDAVAGALAAGP